MTQNTPRPKNDYMEEWARIEIRNTRIWVALFLGFLAFFPLAWLLAHVWRPLGRVVLWAWLPVLVLLAFWARNFHCPGVAKASTEYSALDLTDRARAADSKSRAEFLSATAKSNPGPKVSRYPRFSRLKKSPTVALWK